MVIGMESRVCERRQSKALDRVILDASVYWASILKFDDPLPPAIQLELRVR